MCGAVIGGRASFSTCDEHDIVDGDMVARVLQLQQLTDSRLSTPDANAANTSSSMCTPDIHLEYAYLWHLDQFRKIYVTDHGSRSIEV